MKLFLDSASVDEVKQWVATGFVDGVTTNPTLIAQVGKHPRDVIPQICALVDGPVSAEVTSVTAKGMLEEAKEFVKFGPNVVIKLPLIKEGLIACRELSQQGIPTNVTLCFSPAQALLAAKAGATYVSPFVGRLDDVAVDGMGLIEEIVTIYNNYPALQTEVLVASIRHPRHVIDAAKMGADCATLPGKIFAQLFDHPLTDKGLEQFLHAWELAKVKIDTTGEPSE